MLASMSEIDPRADLPGVDWSDLGVSGLLPTGTVTLLLADVEGSTRLWETQPEQMTAAFARLDQVLSELVAAHAGVRPVEQGEGDSFVVAFSRASDAVACALELQRAPLAPVSLRIGVHTGEVQLRDEANYIGPTINRTARLRDLAHGGQTVLSGVTEALVVDTLPADVWLSDLGTHELRGVPRPERVAQLCHPDLRNEFPPLRTSEGLAAQNLPPQFTRFVGRGAELSEVRGLLAQNRLVTLTGAGGAGKTRLGAEVANQVTGEYDDGVWYVDLAPLTDPGLVVLAVARALGLPDQPGRSTMDSVLRFVRDRRILLLLDNCEHLLDASQDVVVELLAGCPRLTILATSREPLGVAGELIWRVPSLSLADEAVELFADHARKARPDFSITDDNTALITQICARLDGMPLAIELAAARVRALSLSQILDSLHDRFRLLTGGARTAVRRQQTLRASVDWSHALLSEPERILFRRLAAFLGGFDLDAAQAVGADTEVERYQTVDQLGLLVDKSLVVAEELGGDMRYRLLETVRQYAAEKLGESGEADAVRSRHRDHFKALAAALDAPGGNGYERCLEQAETEIDNLRAAFASSLENSGTEAALELASSLQPLWQARGRVREGAAWFDAAFADIDAHDGDVAPAVYARALADKAVLATLMGAAEGLEQAQRALLIAREVDDPALLVRALTACGPIAAVSAEPAGPYFTEAIGLARKLGDPWGLSQILAWQARAATTAGDPFAMRVAGEEGRDLADAIGDRFASRQCRWCLAVAKDLEGDLAGAATQFRAVTAEAEAAHDLTFLAYGLAGQSVALASQGDVRAARVAADAAVEAASEVGGMAAGLGSLALASAALAAGDVATAQHASESAWRHWSVLPAQAAWPLVFSAQAALAGGDLLAAQRAADQAVATTTGWWLMFALATRARVAITQGELEKARHDAQDALARAAAMRAGSGLADILECLAALAGQAGSHREAARLFGAAQGVRQRTGEVRFKIWDAGYENAIADLRKSMSNNDFESAWAEGAALSAEEAIAYAQRGRGERKRPSSGWASLTPAERDVVRLVTDGLGNNDIATRLFVSPRTVQSHLTHVYAKLGLSSRMQLAQEAARHA
ncbi:MULTISPECIES: LuxR C-terminal-related transcriptional regulator [unclassified Mycobacterium]|uniref:helix-turn-helix transcriptional regulator n=1 Tax=unclassified Mycobacterium TaxID=2642494 RepID=UPI00080133F1|nr:MULTISPECIES: LuxR family transcriptional regulator [unclassified Mycobacterium]OBH02566.1 transcriptional regulator [Mycobacterium sp. E2699]OBI57329.1 transcriptional regulator [Mycobacterium sp. E787]